MTYSKEDAKRVLSENETFHEWVELRLKALGFRVYSDVEVSFQEDGQVYIIWADAWDEYESLTANWEELSDETGETFRKAQEARKRAEEMRRTIRARDRARADIRYATEQLERARNRARATGLIVED